MRALPRVALAVVVILMGAAGCGKRGAGLTIENCQPVDEPRLEGVDAESLAGDYSITLVATAGDAADSSVEGRLSLRANPPELRSVPSPGGGARTDAAAPLYGWTDVPVEAVGALRMGDPESRDTQAPGVLVISSEESIVLHLGSEANRRGVIRFDGGYTALWVRAADERGFAGSWTSGLVGREAEGYFCATRVGDESD